MGDLRALAQEVVDAWETFGVMRTACDNYDTLDDCRSRYYEACKAVEVALKLQAQSVDHNSARAILAALGAERETGRAEERDRLMARLHDIGAEAIESYRRLGTQHAEGGMDALLTAADMLADTLNGCPGSGTEVAR